MIFNAYLRSTHAYLELCIVAEKKHRQKKVISTKGHNSFNFNLNMKSQRYAQQDLVLINPVK